MKIIVVSGGFEPIHSGHIALFHCAKQLGDHLIVGVSRDDWLIRKKGRLFMYWLERARIIHHLKMVDAVYPIEDSDGTACDVLEFAKTKSLMANISTDRCYSYNQRDSLHYRF